MACQSNFEVVAITESGFQLIFGFFWLLRLIEFQTHKTGNRKQRAAATIPTLDISMYQICTSSCCGHKILPTIFYFFFGRSSRYIRLMKSNFMQYLSSVYFVSQSLYVLGISVAHHQEVYCIYYYY
jgi:hypothetical protein